MSGLYLRRRGWAKRRAGGQGLVEYALIIAFVIIIVIGSLTALGPAVASVFTLVTGTL
jgi:Flp pilus assembly pilin Flp